MLRGYDTGLQLGSAELWRLFGAPTNQAETQGSERHHGGDSHTSLHSKSLPSFTGERAMCP